MNLTRDTGQLPLIRGLGGLKPASRVSIISQLTLQETWEEFLAYRLLKGRFNWHEFDEADAFVEKKNYLPLATKIALGEGLGLPTKKLINKMGSGKKRVVYSFAPDEMLILKLITFLLYKYDDLFAPNCYAFRRGLKASDAVFKINKAIRGQKMWAYKLDGRRPIFVPFL